MIGTVVCLLLKILFFQNRFGYDGIDFSKDGVNKYVEELQKNSLFVDTQKNDNSNHNSILRSSRFNNKHDLEYAETSSKSITTRQSSLNDEELLSEKEDDIDLFDKTQFLKEYYKINGNFFSNMFIKFLLYVSFF